MMLLTMDELRDAWREPYITVGVGGCTPQRRTLFPIAAEWALAGAKAPTLDAAISAGASMGVTETCIRVAWQSEREADIVARWRELHGR
jgi:hypothetical protein